MAPSEKLVLAPAEALPQEMVYNEMRNLSTRYHPTGIFHSAWNHLEYALSEQSDIDDETRDYYFEYVQDLTAMVMERHDAHQDTQFEALRLASYVPLFRKRCRSEAITAGDCDDLYQSIGSALAYIRPIEVDQPPQSVLVEAGCEALSARSRQPEYILYPTSPREEASSFSHLNHDSYFFDANVKVPLQQKLIPTTKPYQAPVRVLTLMPLLEKAAQRSGIELYLNESQSVSYLLSLIIAETHNAPIDRDEKQLLDRLTRSVLAHKQTPSLAA